MTGGFMFAACREVMFFLSETRNEEPSNALLRQAAAIAAYHSKARDGGTVSVSATRARYVSKPRGAKPGTVTIRKEIVLKVRPGIPKPPS